MGDEDKDDKPRFLAIPFMTQFGPPLFEIGPFRVGDVVRVRMPEVYKPRPMFTRDDVAFLASIKVKAD